ncbi:MAG TPA: hypothetical protein VK177_16225 [Flavobacteriales bacterium]|nr:hypothetical protein [Flavobacteriales bacterium]
MVLKGLEYDPKILIAWSEAIGGNTKMRDWLTKNGFPELGIFCFALRNKEDARVWLMQNGFQHFFALINGVEGNKNALMWLKVHKYPVLLKMAMAGDGDQASFNWLMSKDLKVLAMIAKRIEFIKDQIEEDNNDPHKISFE